LKIAFITTYDAQNISNWSGTPYYMSKAFLDAGTNIEFIGNLNSIPEKNLILRLRNIFYNKILKKRGRYVHFYEPQNLKYIANQVLAKIEKADIDIIFSPGAIPISYLKTNIPIVLWTDATFALMEDYYSSFRGLNKRTIKNCHSYEKKVFQKISLAIFSSKWAANSSIKDYGLDPKKVIEIPYGANIECNRSVNEIIGLNNKKSFTICKLLFIGQDWIRKGGDTAVKIAIELNKQNINTELTIVGCLPPCESLLPSFIKVVGFVDKSLKEGEILINHLYSESHFFILPTIAECTPIVFSEANSYGLPVITTNTGGISSIIKNDVNGKMFDIEVDVCACAEYLGDIFKDFNRYKAYSLKSFNEYLTRLNWKSSIDKVISALKNYEKK